MGEPYEAASAKLNAIVVYYKDVMRRLKRRASLAEKKEEEQAGGDKKPGTDGKPSQGQTDGNASQGTGRRVAEPIRSLARIRQRERVR